MLAPPPASVIAGTTAVNPSERGRLAVVIATAIVVIGALTIRLALSGVADFLAGIAVGLPIGALLGWMADQALRRWVDAYTYHLRGR